MTLDAPLTREIPLWQVLANIEAAAVEARLAAVWRSPDSPKCEACGWPILSENERVYDNENGCSLHRGCVAETPRELAGLLLARKILASVGYECSVADHALEAEVARIKVRSEGAAPGEAGELDGGGDEESTWLMPLMDAFETACDAHAHRTQHVDAAADAAEEAARVKSINDARLALRDAVRATLRRATPWDGGTALDAVRVTVEAGWDHSSCRFDIPAGMNFETAQRHVIAARDAVSREIANRSLCPANRDRLATEHGEG